MTLLVYAAECQADLCRAAGHLAAATVDQYLLPAGPTAVNHHSSMRQPNNGTVDIACLRGSQQQMCHTLLQRLMDGIGRWTPYHYTDPATYYASSVNKGHVPERSKVTLQYFTKVTQTLSIHITHRRSVVAWIMLSGVQKPDMLASRTVPSVFGSGQRYVLMYSSSLVSLNTTATTTTTT